MKEFKVFVNGKNCLISVDNDIPTKQGFFTTVFVEAANAEQAENAVVGLLRNDPKLREALKNEEANPPSVFIESMEEIQSFEGCKLPRTGLAWFVEGA